MVSFSTSYVCCFVRKYSVSVNYNHTTVTLLSLLHRRNVCSLLAVKAVSKVQVKYLQRSLVCYRPTASSVSA